MTAKACQSRTSQRIQHKQYEPTFVTAEEKSKTKSLMDI
jgi:hypothetical protein